MNTFKILIKIILIAVMAFAFQLNAAWWSVAVAGFLISFIVSSNGISSFLSGFLGVGFLWFVMALYHDGSGNALLTARVADIFSLPNTGLLMLITSIIGGLVGGLGALTGSFARELVMPTRKY